jgi:hypothetical protein
MRTTNQEMDFCAKCNRQTLHICQETRCNHILHLLLSIFTVGFWIPIWILLGLSSGRSVPSCTVCGTKAKANAGPSGEVTALIAIVIGCGILFLFNGIHSCGQTSSNTAPSSVTVKATGNPTPYQTDAEIRADNDRVLSEKSEPTATPYVNRLVLKNGKYIDAQSPAPTTTTAPASIWTKEESDSYFKKSNAHLDSQNPSRKSDSYSETAKSHSAKSTIAKLASTPEVRSKNAPQANTHGPLVWVNTNTGVYHHPGTRWYGNTVAGRYISEEDAIAEGDRPAKNGQ